MDSLAAAALVATGSGLVALLVARKRGYRSVVWIAKPLASTGFVVFALALGALATLYGRTVLLALVLSWLGDMLLIPQGARASFLAGLGSFLLAHVAYAGAFLVRGSDALWLVAAALLAAGAIALVWRWLAPHVPPRMRAPVRAYVAAISLMLVCAAGATGASGERTILAGALAFYVSDLAVARERFVSSAFHNQLWGLPLYYGGQLLLASSV